MQKWITSAVFGVVLAAAPMSDTALAAPKSTLYDVGYRTHKLVVQDPYAPPGDPEHLKLNYREWFSPSASDVLVYVHGVQNHSQWFNESGDELAARGFNVYAVDRRGSGLSQGKRAHVHTPFQWVSDLAQMISFVRGKNPGKRVHLMGNSFGGRLVMTYAGAFPETIDSLILETPTSHGQISLAPEEMIELQFHVLKYYDTPLHDDLFTDDQEKLAFMAQDKLAVHQITANFYKMEILMNAGNLQPQSLARLTMPVLVLLAKDDRVVDTPGVIAGVYERLQGSKKLVIYDGVEHYLQFEDRHSELLNDIANWMNAFVPSAARSSARVAMSEDSDSDEEARDWITQCRHEASRRGWTPAPGR